MGVEVIGVAGESNGYGDSMDAFRSAHENNSRIILNLAKGRKKNDPTPAYDPKHPDNAWPTMVFHAEHGEKIIGVSLVGLTGSLRKETEANNQAALKQSQKEGYRAEPYVKPQIAVLDPALEKKAMLEKNKALEGMLTAQADELSKLREMVEKFVKS